MNRTREQLDAWTVALETQRRGLVRRLAASGCVPRGKRQHKAIAVIGDETARLADAWAQFHRVTA